MQPRQHERTEEERARIAERAYTMHEARGGEHGDDLADWYEAERQLVSEGQISAPEYGAEAATFPESAGS